MSDSILATSLIVAAVGAGLMAGVYFAFSGFIMRAFDQLGPVRATAAMNAINEVILRSWFMALFFGTTVLFGALAMIGIMDSGLEGRWVLVTAGLVYVIGMFVCTASFNVPLNRRLADASDDEAGTLWPLYFERWTWWNHVRGLASVAAAGLSAGYLLSYA